MAPAEAMPCVVAPRQRVQFSDVSRPSSILANLFRRPNRFPRAFSFLLHGAISASVPILASLAHAADMTCGWDGHYLSPSVTATSQRFLWRYYKNPAPRACPCRASLRVVPLPALFARGWVRADIHIEETAALIDLVDGQGHRRLQLKMRSRRHPSRTRT